MCPRIDQNPEKDAEGARNGAQKSAIACKINEIFASIYQAVGFFSSLLSSRGAERFCYKAFGQTEREWQSSGNSFTGLKPGVSLEDQAGRTGAGSAEAWLGLGAVTAAFFGDTRFFLALGADLTLAGARGAFGFGEIFFDDLTSPRAFFIF